MRHIIPPAVVTVAFGTVIAIGLFPRIGWWVVALLAVLGLLAWRWYEVGWYTLARRVRRRKLVGVGLHIVVGNPIPFGLPHGGVVVHPISATPLALPTKPWWHRIADEMHKTRLQVGAGGALLSVASGFVAPFVWQPPIPPAFVGLSVLGVILTWGALTYPLWQPRALKLARRLVALRR